MRAAVLAILSMSCAEPRNPAGTCDADCTQGIHPPGVLDPASTEFHGNELARRDYDLATCAGCHGADFAGGSSGVSCLTCHRDGPTACTTCHGDGPTSAAHPVHATAAVTCADCHVVPSRWDDAGHIRYGGPRPPTAQVVFGARAAATLDPADRPGPPDWDGETCRNIYCHGAVLHAGGGLGPEPRWQAASGGGCDRCHASPPPSHERSDCATCHLAAAHLDGALQLGAGCNSCHGGTTTTGAHRVHLQAPSQISSPIACATCHLVPASVLAPGHLDPAPAETTCAAWCHGGSAPAWTSHGEVSCGSCHGIPPGDANHTAAMTLTTCAGCHPRSVDAFGNIRTTNGASEHIDGDVDL